MTLLLGHIGRAPRLIAPDFTCPRSRCATRLLCGVLTTVVIGAIPPAARAETDGVAAAALKAAFLYNFAKFSQWPIDALAPGQPLAICVIGDAAVAEALSQTIKGHAIDGHEVTATLLKFGERDGASAIERQAAWSNWFSSTAGCHLLYVSAAEIKTSSELLLGARGASVFTVSDADSFAESGGVAQLILERDRMRFTINIASARRVRLNISSKLLSLASIVKDKSEAPRR